MAAHLDWAVACRRHGQLDRPPGKVQGDVTIECHHFARGGAVPLGTGGEHWLGREAPHPFLAGGGDLGRREPAACQGQREVAVLSANGRVHRDQLRAVRERPFDLNVVNHVAHPGHDLLKPKEAPAVLHQLSH